MVNKEFVMAINTRAYRLLKEDRASSMYWQTSNQTCGLSLIIVTSAVWTACTIPMDKIQQLLFLVYI